MKTKIKICGVTNIEMASFCDGLGVDFIGLNFVQSSSRYLNPGNAGPVRKAIKKAKVVGVFSDENIEAICKLVDLDFIQIHGEYNPELIKKIGLPVIRAIPIESKKDFKNLNEYKKSVQFFLFDKKDAKLQGGTGKSFDWKLMKGYKEKRPFFLAGGLDPKNVLEAIKTAKPYAVDTASGVEKYGSKDKELIFQFVNAVRSL